MRLRTNQKPSTANTQEGKVSVGNDPGTRNRTKGQSERFDTGVTAASYDSPRNTATPNSQISREAELIKKKLYQY